MSGTPSEQQVFEARFHIDCIDHACVALLAYYVVLNLPHDVRHLWGRRSTATLLSAINWLAITASIISYMPLPNNTTQRCASVNYAFEVIFLVNSAISPLVAALRVHAVSRGNWRWVLPVWLIGMVPIGTNIWELTQEKWLFVSQIGCMSSASISQATSDALVIITRGSVVVSDILVVAATWYYISHTSSIREQLVRSVWAARPNLTTVMFRDGTLYFVTISLLNVIDLVINFSNINTYDGLSMIVMISALSSILVSHFLICIREAAERSIVDSQDDSVTHRWLSSIEFAADIVNPSAGDSDADAFFDLENDMDSKSEDSTLNGINDEIELHEYATTSRSVDAFMS